jgi:hypothetical protein
MYRLKGCLRCGGDILVNHDQFGWYEDCIQCGHQSNVDGQNKLIEELLKNKKGSMLVTQNA